MISNGGTATLGLYDFKRQVDSFGGVDYFRVITGGYLPNSRVMLDNGDIVQNKTYGNLTNNPNVNMTGWGYPNHSDLSVKDFGAIGDGTLHTLQEWVDSGKFSNLAAIQVEYPFVTNLTDSIDWAAIQKALNTGKHIDGPFGTYELNKSLYYKTSNQQVLNLGRIRIASSLGIPCIHVGASDTNGTPSLVWRGAFKGTDFYGVGSTRAVGSAAINLVSCSQIEFNLRATGFYEGVSVTGACYANTFNTLTLVQNTYGLGDRTATADLQGSVFIGGRIEQNKEEGVRCASVNITFVGTVIEGNGLWDGGSGSKPEFTSLSSSSSGAVTFEGCYMESLGGKSASGIIEIAPNATRHIFINGGHYFGGVANKGNIVVVNINSPASVVASAILTGVYVNDVKNYARGVISGNSRVSVVNCFPREDLALTLDVTVGSGSPMIQQIDRTYHRTNQNVRAASFQSDGAINGTTITTTGTTTADYLAGTNTVLGLGLYNGNLTQRRRSMSVTATSFTCVPLSDIAGTGIYVFEIIAVQRLTNSNGRGFKAILLVAGNGGSPTIINSQVIWNSDVVAVPTFTSDGTGVVAGNLNSSATYDFYVTKQTRS